jgi:hypothetical protein
MRRPKPRSLSSRFKPRHRETNPTVYEMPEQWQKPAITPPRFSVRGQHPGPSNEYHIRAAYEAGQRDALAERMKNAALDRQSMPRGPSHVISFERLRPGFEDEFRSDGSFSQMYVGNSKETNKFFLMPALTTGQRARSGGLYEPASTSIYKSRDSRQFSSLIHWYPVRS